MSSMSDIFRVIQHTVPSHRQNDALVLSFKQYIPLDNPNPRSDDVTIIGAPGNGHVKVSAYLFFRDVPSSYAHTKAEGCPAGAL